ncbi:hypothetical protein [Aliiglaciecola sp. M165]|uniref:hypothetical protein n=1 Tax=Aliiglaciecola sp. M165 TaxID=2593649 RepID=UPI0011942C53|nr:hypothetical protein [Aliiglaciecola sp. M165]TRY30770.1 hypothetical protein FM019_12855 [Aliiglaciecola sp. M165]
MKIISSIIQQPLCEEFTNLLDIFEKKNVSNRNFVLLKEPLSTKEVLEIVLAGNAELMLGYEQIEFFLYNGLKRGQEAESLEQEWISSMESLLELKNKFPENIKVFNTSFVLASPSKFFSEIECEIQELQTRNLCKPADSLFLFSLIRTLNHEEIKTILNYLEDLDSDINHLLKIEIDGRALTSGPSVAIENEHQFQPCGFHKDVNLQDARETLEPLNIAVLQIQSIQEELESKHSEYLKLENEVKKLKSELSLNLKANSVLKTTQEGLEIELKSLRALNDATQTKLFEREREITSLNTNITEDRKKFKSTVSKHQSIIDELKIHLVKQSKELEISKYYEIKNRRELLSIEKTFLHKYFYARKKISNKLNKNVYSEDDEKLLLHSDLFDLMWYLNRYPDVKHSGVNPVKHYLVSGVTEKRLPSLYFDTFWYLEKNKDVKESGINPLLHYIKYGFEEGREIRGVKGGNRKI